jgi:hypothetical protein
MGLAEHPGQFENMIELPMPKTLASVVLCNIIVDNQQICGIRDVRLELSARLLRPKNNGGDSWHRYHNL